MAQKKNIKRISLYVDSEFHEEVEKLSEKAGRTVTSTYQHLLEFGFAAEIVTQAGRELVSKLNDKEEAQFAPPGGTLGRDPKKLSHLKNGNEGKQK